MSSIEADLDALSEYAAPVGRPTVIKTIGALASLFQVPVPDDIGLDLYVLALSKMPAPVFNAARNKLVLSHKWPRLPVPADFIAAGEEDQKKIEVMRLVLGSAHAFAERALAHHNRA